LCLDTTDRIEQRMFRRHGLNTLMSGWGARKISGKGPAVGCGRKRRQPVQNWGKIRKTQRDEGKHSREIHASVIRRAGFPKRGNTKRRSIFFPQGNAEHLKVHPAEKSEIWGGVRPVLHETTRPEHSKEFATGCSFPWAAGKTNRCHRPASCHPGEAGGNKKHPVGSAPLTILKALAVIEVNRSERTKMEGMWEGVYGH